jgi:hypothetical protein
MSQTDQENLNEHPKETTVHNQIKMTSVVLLFSTIAVTGLVIFIIFWLFVVHTV